MYIKVNASLMIVPNVWTIRDFGVSVRESTINIHFLDYSFFGLSF